MINIHVTIGFHFYEVPVIQGISTIHVENAVFIELAGFIKLYFISRN